MTPEFPNSKREELEMRITALLLGELSTEESASVREVISRDPELAALEQELKSTIGLVREATAEAENDTEAEAPRLSARRREQLLATFWGKGGKSVRRSPVVDWRTLGALAAMVMALFGVGAFILMNRWRPTDGTQFAVQGGKKLFEKAGRGPREPSSRCRIQAHILPKRDYYFKTSIPEGGRRCTGRQG